jgi:hypothetical protein
MARFQLTASHELVIGGTRRHLNAGEIVADSVANAQADDLVWDAMSSSTISEHMTALDKAATKMKAESPHADVPAATGITGAASIDA